MPRPPAASIFGCGRQPVEAPRHQRDRRAVRRQHLRKARAEPTGSARDERDAAIKIEQSAAFMALASSHPP